MSKIKADTLSNLGGTQEVPVDTVVQGSAKAWVNFNGTGTVAIRAAFNVSSITDNGTGDYTANFTAAMSDANYSVSGVGRLDTGGGNHYSFLGIVRTASSMLAGSVRVATLESTALAGYDYDTVNVVIFR